MECDIRAHWNTVDYPWYWRPRFARRPTMIVVRVFYLSAAIEWWKS